MSGICPCCGQATPDDGVLLVSLESNLVSRGGLTIYVTAQQAELVHILKSGRVVSHETIIRRIYGAGEEPGDAGNVMKTHISRLRRVLAPLGVSIKNVFARGYYLVLDDSVPVDGDTDNYLAGLAAIQAAA